MAHGTTQKLEFKGAQGDTLAAALETPSGEIRAYALFAHCFSCSKDIHAARRISERLCGLGFAVLRFDFTGLGQSDGDFANTNFSSNVEDLVRAAAFLKDNYEAPSLLIGHSLGGAAVVMAAEEIPEAKAVVTLAAPAEADHVAHNFAADIDKINAEGAAEVKLGGRPFTIKKQFLEDIQGKKATEAAARLKRPFLIFHAPLDETVGIDNATRLFIAAKHPKSFVSLDTADHLLSRKEDSRYVADVLAAWASRFLPAAEAPPRDWLVGVATSETSTRGTFTQDVVAGGHTFTIDVDKEDGGDGLGPNPTQTVEGALAACGAITVQMYARRKGWDLKRAKVSVQLDREAPDQDAHAARYLEKHVEVEGDLDAAQRARLHEIADKCPVQRMLTNGVHIRSVLDE